jgi:RNA polymerase sigma factor for flagellar operon FliA
MPLLQRHARQLHRRYRDLIQLEELVSHGFMGLRRAAERFDPERGIPFLRYAWYRIDGEMRRAVQQRMELAARAREAGRHAVTLLGDDADVLNDDDSRHRRRLTEYCDAVLVAMLAGAVSHATGEAGRGFDTHDERLDLKAAGELLERAFEEVEPEQATLVRRHYFEGHQLRDIARDMGISYATARRRHQTALMAMGDALRRLRTEA